MTGSLAAVRSRIAEMALVSVIIPARNAVRTIGRALRSLVADATVISEIILVDDGSEDDTAASALATATRFGLPLKTVRIQAGSAGTARNAGMALAQAEYVYFLDADDELMSGGLEQLVEALHGSANAGMAVGAK
jgi:O-antigen biosynthesis protein